VGRLERLIEQFRVDGMRPAVLTVVLRQVRATMS
jgi:hypothetical protein